MNEIRRLVRQNAPLLALAALVFTCWMALLASSPAPEWPQSPLPATAAPVVPTPAEVRPFVDLQTYSGIWEVPLFTPGRQADAGNASQVAALPLPADLVLTGVMVAPPLRVAFLRQGTGEAIALREGQALPGGWTVAHIEEQRVELVNGGSHQALEISSPRLPLN